MPLLVGEFRNDNFYYRDVDWGNIYSFIHKVALERFEEYENTLPLQ